VPTKEEILELVGSGLSYEQAAEKLGINTGQAYLTATGLPADGSDSLAPEERQRPGIRWGSVQMLVNPPIHPSSKAAQAVEWLAKRVASDSTMKDAARRRDAAPPPLELPEEEEKVFDVVDVLGRDHNQIKYLLEQLEAIRPFNKGGSRESAAQRQSILDMMIVALAAHEAAEEALFWPAVKDWLGKEGEELADRATTQEQQGKETLAELEGMEGTDERFDELVEKLTGQLRKHVAFEDMVFLKLQPATGKPDRVSLGQKVVRFERHGPTHPHAKAGSSPASTRLAPTLRPFDRAKDAVKGRPADRKGQALSSEEEAQESNSGS
jgi:hypothetical protein